MFFIIITCINNVSKKNNNWRPPKVVSKTRIFEKKITLCPPDGRAGHTNDRRTKLDSVVAWKQKKNLFYHSLATNCWSRSTVINQQFFFGQIHKKKWLQTTAQGKEIMKTSLRKARKKAWK